MPLRLSLHTAAMSLVCVAALTLSSCANPPDSHSGGASASSGSAGDINKEADQPRISTPRVDSIAAQVPQAIRKRGTLDIVTFAGLNPPLSFYATDNKSVIGMEPDMGYLLADVLGLKAQIHTVSWENMFVGLDSGKYDVAVANISDTEERKKKYDFASYRKEKVAFETQKGSDLKITSPKDVAGKTVAVHSGTIQEQMILDWNRQNVQAGQKSADIKYFPAQSDVYLALRSNRVDLYLGSNPSVAYHVASAAQTKVVGTFSGADSSRPNWIAATTKKGNGLVRPLERGIDAVIENGAYDKIVKRWYLTDEAVTESRVNPPGLQ
ncbi:ABC transporter substrate-binding protein [Streptomyces asiaticus]